MKKLLLLLLTTLAVQGQTRFVRVVDTFESLLTGNPLQVHTNVFVVGPTNSGIYSFIVGATNHATLPYYPTTYTGATGVFVLITTPTGAGVTNINSILSGNYNPGANVAFTTNGYGVITITSSGGGTNSGYSLILDEGVPLAQETIIDFVGDGVVATPGTGKTVVTIPGVSASQVFSGFYGGLLPSDTPTTSAALAYDLDPPGVMYFWDGLIWY